MDSAEGMKIKKSQQNNNSVLPTLDPPLDCNCDPKRRRRRRGRRRAMKKEVSRVSGLSLCRPSSKLSPNCPKSHLSGWPFARTTLLLCLIAMEQSSFVGANQSEPPTMIGQTEHSGSSGRGCLPLIGALFGKCEPQAETATTTAAAARATHESLKVNQSAGTMHQQQTQQQWNKDSGRQVKEAASFAGSEPSYATSSASSSSKTQQSLNVLCNSRCNCVILDLSSQRQQQQQPADRQLVTPDTNKQDQLAALSSSVAAAAPGSGSSDVVDQANGPLIAFNEDYSLDYEQPQLEQQPQQILSAPLPASSDPSNASSADLAGARQTQLQPLRGSDPSIQPHQLSVSQVQVANNNLQLFPLQQHLQAGNGGGSKASSPQLYAQSLYSSQAPKLSYHAHAPYLKQSAPSVSSSYLSSSSSSSLSSPSSPSSLSQRGGLPSSMSSETTPPGVGQTNYHHYLHHSKWPNYHLRHHSSSIPAASSQARSTDPKRANGPELDSASDQITLKQQQVQVRALIPLKTLNASNSEQIKQLANNYSHSEVPENLSTGLETLLTKLDNDNVQSLILSRNDIDFEYLIELYALLVGNIRYLEHHLVAFDGKWSQSYQTNQQTTSSQQQQQSSKSGTTNQRLNSLFNGGKLYTLIQSKFLFNSNNTKGPIISQWQNRSDYKQMILQPSLIRALDLSHNKLKWLINDQFKALKHVQSIRLDHNRIRYIHQHAFSGLESLRFLNLNYNRLQMIYIEQFQTNYNLLALMLRSNYLAYLRGGSFASLSQLKRLDLSQNKLTILSNNAFIGLESLELLNCSSNQFAHVPSGSFHPLVSLKRLDLSNNLITELAPGTFFHLPVEELWLGHNDQLVTIERGALWDLAYLSRLHLNSNPMLANINSQSFVSAQNLQSIDIDDCPSLDSNARQLLDNITMTATSRQLRLEQQRQQQQQSAPRPEGATSASPPSVPVSIITLEEPQIVIMKNLTNNTSTSSASTLVRELQDSKMGDQLSATKSSNSLLGNQQHQSQIATTKYLYYLGTMAFLVLALALVFEFTSSGHYMESRRRRRRVYEFGDPAPGQQIDRSAAMRKHSISSAYSSGRSQSSQSRSDDCDSIFVCDDTNRQVTDQFELYESANNVILQQQPQPSATNHMAVEQEQQQIEEKGLGGGVMNLDDSPPLDPSALCCPDCDRDHLQAVAAAAAVADRPLGMAEEPKAEVDTEVTAATLTTMSETVECCQQLAGEVAGPIKQTQTDQQQQPTSSPSIDLIHSQLIAAGFDYGHANCAHFYQSLGPALQLADITANFVNNIDFY